MLGKLFHWSLKRKPRPPCSIRMLTTVGKFSILLEKQGFVMTRCSIINCACLKCCVLCSKTLIGALMKLAAIQNNVLFSVIKVNEACPSEFGPDVKQQLSLRTKYECFCLNDRIKFAPPPPLELAGHNSKWHKLHHYCGITQPSMQ